NEFLVSPFLSFYAIAAWQNIDKGVLARGTGLHYVLLAGPDVVRCDRRIGNRSAAGVRNSARNGPIHVLCPRRLKRKDLKRKDQDENDSSKKLGLSEMRHVPSHEELPIDDCYGTEPRSRSRQDNRNLRPRTVDEWPILLSECSRDF